MKALELCGKATDCVTSDPRRAVLIDKAIDLSPDLCSQAYLMKFELLSACITVGPFTKPAADLCVSALKDGVSAGRKFV